MQPASRPHSARWRSYHNTNDLSLHCVQKSCGTVHFEHTCREDAATVLELYRQCILTDPSQIVSEQELVDAYACGMLD